MENDATPQEKEDAFFAGRNAGFSGQPIEANPHKAGSELAREWSIGHKKGRAR